MTASENTREKRPPLISVIGFPLLIVGIFILAFAFGRDLWTIFSSPENVRVWVSQWGLLAPAVFVAVQILQVLVFIIPGETVQVAGGYLFGFFPGLALTSLGIAIGSAVNFFLARLLGTPFVEYFFKKEQIARFDRVASSPNAQIGFFLLFVIPGIPKDILCYVAGLSPMKFFYFLAVSMVGRIPGIVGSTFMGSAAADRQWTIALIVFSVACVLFIAGYLYRKRIEECIHKLMDRPHKENPQ